MLRSAADSGKREIIRTRIRPGILYMQQYLLRVSSMQQYEYALKFRILKF
eukprot:SAG31_NODE_2205_length_6195_cov_4.592520_1_plen_49_part_10